MKEEKKDKLRIRKLKTENEDDIAFEVLDKDGKVRCKMRLCENADTGEMQFIYGKGCPKGMIEKFAGKIATRTLRFVQEKKEDEKED